MSSPRFGTAQRILVLSAVLPLLAALTAFPARAASYGYTPSKSVEITPFIGYYIASDLYTYSATTSVGLNNSFMYGGRITFNPSRRAGVEFAYTHEGSEIEAPHGLSSAYPGGSKIGDIGIDAFDLNFLGYQESGNPRVSPFASLGFGWAWTSPDVPQINAKGNTLFNFNFALGTKIQMNEKVALRLEGRWRVTDTHITTNTYTYCDFYGFCYNYSSNWYNSGELIGGLTYTLPSK